MSYTLTADDEALLQRLAGGLNYNYATDPTLDAGGRFGARVLRANATALNALVDRATGQPDVPPAPPPPSEDAISSGVPLALYETRVVPCVPGQTYAEQAAGDGRFSVEVLGSPPVAQSVGERGVFDNDPTHSSYGAGTAPPLAVKAGEWCNWRFVAEDGAVRNARPQLLGP